ATNAMRLMNFTQDRDLLQAVSMGNDVQMYVRLAVKNLRRFGHRPMVLTEAKAAARLCGGIAIVETQTICGFQDAIAPHERWRAVGVTSRHYYVLFLQRWRLIARTLRLGYSMLSLDTDIYWSADPLAVATAALPGVGVAVAVGTVHKTVSERQAAVVAEIVVSQRVIKRIDNLVTEALLKAFFSDDALRAIYREKADKVSGAGGTSVALLAAIRSDIAGVRPKLQRIILETVGVKPFLAAGFGTQSGRVHSDFRRRYLRLTRANGWLEDERLNSTQLTALLHKFLSELTSASFRSDVDAALNAIVCAMRSAVITDMDEAAVLEGVGNANEDADTADSECRSLLSAIVEVCRRCDRDGITLCASARGAGPVARAAAAAGTGRGADKAGDDDEDPRVARIVELLTASFASAQQRRTPRETAGADTTGGAPPARRPATRDCSICLLKGKGTFKHYYDDCPELKGLTPEAINALKKEARAAGHDSWWTEKEAKKEARKAADKGKGGKQGRSRGGGRGGQPADPPKSTALALSKTKELTDTIRGLLALTPPPSPPSGDMDALDDVSGPTGARVERGRGSIHNGVADQSLANPDMSIAELLFTSFGSLLRRLALCYSERHLIPALLELQPSGVTLTLEQSSGETCAEESMQSSVWVAAVVLCELMQRPCAAFPTGVGHWRGKRVLELGAGCGACGILAARCGASSVQLTDLAPLLPLLRRNAAANGVADCCSAVELEWGCPLPPFLLEPSSLDIILGADITAFALAADFECEEISAQLQGSGRGSGREGDSESGRASEGESGRDCDPDEKKPPEPACGGAAAATLVFCVRLAEPRPGPGGEEEEASPEEAAALAEYRAACERLGLRGV
ncbi:hypothetical protein EMIHUDRAFT_122462, partial [Emiliania huxleyi CCMP1516]